MTERKMRRLVTAGTVVAVVVLFLMIVVLIVQMFALSIKKRQIMESTRERESLIQAVKNAEEELERNKALRDFYETDEGKLYWALKYGYRYDENE